jgi:hypothetical protein
MRLSVEAGRFARVFETLERSLVGAVAARQQAGSFHAVELEHLAAYAKASEDNEFAYLEVAALLHMSDRAARLRLAFAQTLTDLLPQTLVALREGRIEEFKAQIIADGVGTLTAGQAAQVEERVLPKAAEQTPTQLRRAVTKAVMAVDPEGAEERRQEKLRGRRVSCQPTEDGEAVLSIYHSADRIAAMYSAITSQAHHLKAVGGESRTIAQLEADIAGELILGGAAMSIIGFRGRPGLPRMRTVPACAAGIIE